MAPPICPASAHELYDNWKSVFVFCSDRMTNQLRVIRKPWRRCVPTWIFYNWFITLNWRRDKALIHQKNFLQAFKNSPAPSFRLF